MLLRTLARKRQGKGTQESLMELPKKELIKSGGL